jgi:alkyl sulfatase BDS1-like metallo-beta-lactamase superfamily hydrolase
LGGAQKVMALAKESHDKGEYRWAAELLNHLIFAQPDNVPARLLQANIFEQMGYQAESAGWRNTYLTGAHELRNGLPKQVNAAKVGPDLIVAMSSELIFDFLGVRLNSDLASGKEIKINIAFPDKSEQFLLELKNSHLSNIKGIESQTADVSITMNRSDLNLMLMKVKTLPELMQSGALTFEGDINAFVSVLQMLEEFPFWFNIATP